MKSVGEVMGIGRTFQESLQKALRGLEIGIDGLTPILDADDPEWQNKLRHEFQVASSERLRYVADSIRIGLAMEEIKELTSVDFWFLVQIKIYRSGNCASGTTDQRC